MIKFNSLEDEIELFSTNTEIGVRVEKFADQKIVIVDNFYKHPEKVRELAQLIPSTRSPVILHALPGSRVEATYHLSHLGYIFTDIINNVFAEDVVDVEETFIQNCINRSTFLVNVQNSDLPVRVPHIDNSGVGRWAVGIFLNTPDECVGGTAFYKYKGNTTADIKQLMTDSEAAGYTEYLQESDGKNWEKIHLAEMKFNRMIIYRQNALHTPYIPPNTFTDENPRLIQMIFI